MKVTDGSVTVTSVVTDSREAVAGSLFVCIAGERVDGHDYAARAVEQGAVAVLASRPLEGLSVPVLLVQDTVRALGAVAALWRDKSSARVVGITGSAGKTTVKELLAHVLSRRGKTACNALNLARGNCAYSDDNVLGNFNITVVRSNKIISHKNPSYHYITIL